MRTISLPTRVCISLAIALLLCNCTKTQLEPEAPPTQAKTHLSQTESTSSTVWLTYPDHIIFVWFENKGYSQIIGSSSAPYINSLLKNGTLFTSDYALFHPSYPNYISFFSGSNQGVTTDYCIDGTPFGCSNLYTVLKAAGKSVAWYSEGLPGTGS